MFWNPWCSRILIIMEILLLPRDSSSCASLLESPSQATPSKELNIHFQDLLHILQVYLLRPSLLSDGRSASFLLYLASLLSTLALPKRLLSQENMSTNVVARHWVNPKWACCYNTGDITWDAKNSTGDNRFSKKGLLMSWATAFDSLLMFSLYWQEAEAYTHNSHNSHK